MGAAALPINGVMVAHSSNDDISARHNGTNYSAPLPHRPQPLLNATHQLDPGKMLRAKLTEIFASTANECLAELGFPPGLSAKVAEMEQQLNEWKAENAKLFEDNQVVLRALHDKREQLRIVSASESEKTRIIKDLESKVVLLKAQNHDLKIEVDRLAAILTADPQKQPMFKQHKKLVEQYQSAMAENRMLKNQLHARANQAIPSQPQPHVVPPHFYNGSLSQPGPPNRVVPPTQPVPAQNSPTSAPPRTAPPTIYRSPVHIQPSPQHLRRASDSMLPTSVGQFEPQQPFPETFAFREQPKPEVTQPVSKAPEPIQDTNQQYTPGKLPVFASPFQTNPATLASPSNVHQQAPRISSPLVSQPISQPLPDTSSQVPPQASPQLPTSVPSPILGVAAPSQPTDRPIPSDQATLAAQTTNLTAPNVQTPSIPVSEPESLKRTSSSLSPHEPDQHKKPRLDTTNDTPVAENQDATTNDVGDGTEESDDEPIRVGPDGLRLIEDCLAEVICDGSDGEAGTCFYCNARYVRYGQELGVEKPKPFGDATQDEIVQHFVNEHRTAWDRMRNVD